MIKIGTLLAREFNVSDEQIRGIVKNKFWKDKNYKPLLWNGNAKLNWDIVNQIRERYKNGEKQSDLARELGMNHQNISRIVNNKRWKI